MNKLQRLYDSFENYSIEYQEITEADGSIGDLGEVPKGVLGVFKVKHAFGAGIPFGISRNGRLYTKKAWENALKKDPSFKEAFEHNMVVGMLSHPEKEMTYDDMIREELASHLLKDIKYKEITPDSGVYEATFYILDTKAGRTLKALLAAGAKPAVSTRAYGSFKEEFVEYKGKKFPVINENDFKLVTLDIVSIPGIKSARISDIKLSESLKEDIEYLKEKAKEYNCKGGICDLFDDIKEDKKETFTLNDYKKVIKILSEENKKLKEQLINLQSDLNNSNDSDDSFKKIFISFVEVLSKLLKFNEKYKEEFNELITILDKDNKFENSDISTVKSIIEKLKKDEMIDDSIKKIIERMEKFLNKDDKETKETNENLLFYFYADTIDGLSDLIAQYKAEIDKYFKDNEELKKMFQKSVQSLSSQLIQAEEKLNESKNEIKHLKEELQLKEKELNEFKEKLNEKNKIIEKLEKEKLNESKNEIKHLKEELEEKNYLIEDLENKYKELEEKLNELNEIKEQNIELKEELYKEKKELKKYKEIDEKFKKLQIKYIIEKFKISEEKARTYLEQYEFDEAIEKLKIIKRNEKPKANYFDIKEAKEKNEVLERIERIIR